MQRSGSASRRTPARAASAALTTIVALLGPLAAPAPAGAQPRCAQPVAIVRTVDNQVRVVLASQGPPVTATRDMAVCPGEAIEVAARSRARVLITASNTLLTLDQNSRLEIGSEDSARSYVSLLRGALLFITRVRRSFEVRTPFVNASVEGTEFVVQVGADSAIVTVLEGTVRAANDLGAVVVGAGQQALATKGQAPQLRVIVRPRDAVQFAVYYEPVMPADTFEKLDAVPAANQDAAFFVRRAALLLNVGQLDAARADLDQAQKLNPDYGDGYAVRAIAALALNDKPQALESGRRAVELAPNSTAARLALSYALQADAQLEAARDMVSQAVTTSPNDAPAWTRLAELRLMLDDVGEAEDAAQRAVKLAPEAARPHVVLGFTQLAQLRTSDAERTFDQALSVQPSDPLAHLGRGLSQIRRGKLDAGRSELEMAVALNPEDALLRSYLGKAYSDEKRESLAEQQFASAKALDPQDPTAWYYHAIQKQALNRPVEALTDIEEAIRLNDHRAVYRSRLLLDDDSAGRGARLGRVYRDLGFEQLALVEGWKSVSVDPTNHAAHRLLADNYLVLPGHQIARDSELLQAQLLQPLNINPVQPRLAGNGLNFLDDTGAYGVGYNEFTRLFVANQIRFVGDGIVGQHSTLADNVIVSGLFDRFSYSAGQFHYESDGIRPNNDSRHDIYDVFFQTQITRASSAQIEIRTTDVQRGDQRLLFDPTNFLPTQRAPGETKTIRLGGRHAFTKDSLVLISYLHHKLDGLFDLSFPFPPFIFRRAVEEEANFFEVRHLQRWPRVNLTLGGGRYDADQVETRTVGSAASPPVLRPIHHTNAYVYADVRIAKPLLASVGLSHDDFDSGLVKRTPFNPKLGLTWTLNPQTTVRAGAMRSLKRTLVVSQTIEPTQVSGFNQFFDDDSGTDAWRYGVAVDRRMGAGIFAGAELSRRDLESPAQDPRTGATIFNDARDWVGSGYVYAAITEAVAISGEYQYARLTRDPLGNNVLLLAESTTHRLGIEGRVFSRWGGFGRVRAWIVNQEGRFQNARLAVFPGSDEFVTLDASAGYRLPRRLGVASIDIRNAFNEEFNYQDRTPEESTLVPVRQVSVRFTLTF